VNYHPHEYTRPSAFEKGRIYRLHSQGKIPRAGWLHQRAGVSILRVNHYKNPESGVYRASSDNLIEDTLLRDSFFRDAIQNEIQSEEAAISS
jgi:hypothetical protein